MFPVLFKVVMPLLMLFAAIVVYTYLWIKVIKPILDRENINGTTEQQQSEQPNNGGSEQHDDEE